MAKGDITVEFKEFDINSLESLLNEKNDAMDKSVFHNKELLKSSPEVPPLRAEKNATIEDFIEMVSHVVSTTMRDDNVVFDLDEGKRLSQDPNTEINGPYITYKVIERKPKLEVKPRERQNFTEETFSQTDARQGRIYGQTFTAKIQFNIIASEYKLANRVMTIFEDLIFNYKHFFMKNGVAELLLEKQITDKDYDIYRQNLSVRNLIYYVEVEKQYVMFDTKFEEIFVK